MSEVQKTIVAEHDEQQFSYGKYIAGFVSSVALTLLAYLLATRAHINHNLLIGFLAVLAITQFMVQMVFFLHIGEERQPRWKLYMLLLMLCVVLIVVLGSLWIMNNLNYRMMSSPQTQEQYLKSQDAL